MDLQYEKWFYIIKWVRYSVRLNMCATGFLIWNLDKITFITMTHDTISIILVIMSPPYPPRLKAASWDDLGRVYRPWTSRLARSIFCGCFFIGVLCCIEAGKKICRKHAQKDSMRNNFVSYLTAARKENKFQSGQSSVRLKALFNNLST